MITSQELLPGVSGRSSGHRRVLLLITSLQYGGADSQVVALALGLQQRGWKALVACMVPPRAFTEVLEQAGIPVRSLDMPRGVPDMRAISRLGRLIQEFQPTVVHSHMVHANLLARATRLFAPMRVLISTAHNLREESEKGGPTWHKELLYRLTDFLADKTTIISHAAFRRYVAVGAVPRSKFCVIPNGVDTARFAPSKETRFQARKELGFADEFVWMAVGRMVLQKDYPNLLRAFARIREPKARVIIAGRGPLQPDLQALRDSLGLRDRVKFVGVRSDIEAWYNAADAFVMSSSFEGLSAALLEAAAIGLPSVVTDVGGNSEIVLDRQSGYLVPPGNSEALAASMEALMKLPSTRWRDFSQAARNLCVTNYSLDTVVGKWETLYADLATGVTDSARVAQPTRNSGKVGLLPKVMYVITRAELGGAQVHLLDLLKGLRGKISPVVITGEDGFLCDECRRRDIPVFRMRHLLRPIKPKEDLRGVLELANLIRGEQPDLIHAHTSKAGIIARLAGALTGKAVVFTAHTWSFLEHSSKRQDNVAALAERWVARLGGPILTVSEENRNIALARRIGHPRQLMTVWNGMPDVLWQARHGRSRVPRIVMVARFAEQKDHPTLLRALAAVHRPWSLVLPGEGPLLQSIKSLATELGIRDRIEFPGNIETIPQLLSECDIFALSSHVEGLPLSILEAMRAGLPVLATNTGGVRELVSNGETGFLLEREDIQQWRQRIDELLSDMPLRAALGAEGRNRFLRDFQLDAMTAKVLSVYRHLLNGLSPAKLPEIA